MIAVSFRVFQPVLRFAQFYGEKASPVEGVVFFFGTFQALFLNSFVLGIEVFLYSGVTAIKDEYNIYLLRCGRRTWVTAQLITILIIAITTMLMWVISIFLVMIPVFHWDSDWDRVWRTLCLARFGSTGIPLDMPSYIIHNYSPIEGFVYSCLLKTLVFVLLGNVVYLGNMISRWPLGTALGVLLALEDAFFLNTWSSQYIWFSPATMSRLYMLEKQHEYIAPTPIEAILFMMIISFLLALAARNIGKHKLEA